MHGLITVLQTLVYCKTRFNLLSESSVLQCTYNYIWRSDCSLLQQLVSHCGEGNGQPAAEKQNEVQGHLVPEQHCIVVGGKSRQ